MQLLRSAARSLAVALPLAAGSLGAFAQLPTDVESLIARASGYVVEYFGSLSLVVCEERYEQRLNRTAVMYSTGLRPQGIEDQVISRVLVSDYLIVQPPGMRGWMAFRDVFSVDGAPVRDREDRLTELFLRPSAGALRQAEQIRAESSRYNISSAVRDINVPTFALQFLLPEVRARFAFRLKDSEEVDGVPARVVEYEETARPTLITGERDEPVPARGSLWIDPASGAVLRTRLETKSGVKKARIDVSFTREPKLGLMVPAEMLERHTMVDETLVGTASYGNYRQFKVETTEQIKVK